MGIWEREGEMGEIEREKGEERKGGDIESQTDSGKVVARGTKSKNETIEIVSERERERGLQTRHQGQTVSS